MCQVNLVRLQNGGGFNSDEGTITVRTVFNVFLKFLERSSYIHIVPKGDSRVKKKIFKNVDFSF